MEQPTVELERTDREQKALNRVKKLQDESWVANAKIERKQREKEEAIGEYKEVLAKLKKAVREWEDAWPVSK